MGSSTPGRLVLALLGVWIVLGMARPVGLAQDAIPLLVAGELVVEDPGSVYVDGETGGIFALEPEFRDRYCAALAEMGVPDPETCARHAVAYVGPPGLLPFLALPGAGDPGIGVHVVRAVGLLAASASMLILWARLAPTDERGRWALLASTVLLTPLVHYCAVVGQTSTLLLLSAVLGTGTGVLAGRGWLRGLVWAATVLVKASPAALGAVLVVQRRWTMLAVGVGAVLLAHLVAVAVGGWDLLGAFLDASGAVAGTTSEMGYGDGLEGVVARVAGGLSADTRGSIAWALRVAAGLIAAVGFFRMRDHDVAWAFAWSVLVVLLPVSWWHYSLVSFGALAVAVSRSAQPRRWAWVPPTFLVAALPMTIAAHDARVIPAADTVWMAAAAVAVYLLGAGRRSAPGGVARAEEVGRVTT